MKKIILFSALMLCINSVTSAQTETIDNWVRGTGLNQHNYVGAGWVHGSNTPGFLFATLSFTNVAGSYVTFTFTGVKIEWFTEKKNWHGIVAVSIDGGAETMIDLYSVNEIHTTVYNSGVLTQGTHTIKLRATGTKNAASTGYYAIHDSFTIFNKTPDASGDITSTYAGAESGKGFVNETPPFYNTGFGYRAFALSNSTYSTAMGAYALESNTGFGSTGVGYNSLKSNSGQLNTAVGYNTLMDTQGQWNTAVGAYALQKSTGTGNTAVGFGALPHGSPSSNNTAVGYNALWSLGQSPNSPNAIPLPPTLWVGSNNTAVGANAGPPNGPDTGISGIANSTALGSNARVTASHQVRIGDANVTSIGGQVSWSTLSDGRFKRDLQEDVSGLEFVNKLRPVSYTVDKVALQKFLGVPDSLQTKVEGKEGLMRQTGFVAQEVDKLMKKSGYVFNGVDAPKNEKDPYTLRYAEFVVPLVKAVQELSAQNEEQKNQIAVQQSQIDQLLEQLGKIEEGNSGLKSSEISLLQNTPNPFSLNTEIKMILPETAINANIIVYNLEGKQLKELKVQGRGNVSATILGNELSAGMYIYALIVDGEVVDTKRMILTK